MSKNVLLGVTGGIAAYKSAELCRQLVKAGYSVRVVMTHGAKAFIQPMTFQALSGNDVRDSLLDEHAEAGMGHIELARWADLIVVAPATADFIAHMAHGFAHDLLATLCLASKAPVAVVPAMNQQMWLKSVTQKNVSMLADYNMDAPTLVWGPDEGSQACGDVGPGRMLEPDAIVSRIQSHFGSKDRSNGLLAGKTVLLTAGPTREALDPVRYISNHSSGKMGYALAEAALQAGAKVILVSGPVQLKAPVGIEVVPVASALEMFDEVMARVSKIDIFVATAAVADYRPESAADQKIKKTKEEMVIRLTRNPDIVAAVAASEPKPFTVGFAAETNEVESYAKDKMQRKKLDMIIANDVSRADIGFNSDSNEATIFWPNGEKALGFLRKTEMAEEIIAIIADKLPR